jgi:ferredoxin
MTKEFITMAHYPVPCHCEGGECSACDSQTDELQFASMKEIEEFYNIHGEDMHQDPGEIDLEAMIEDMINDGKDFDTEYKEDED